MTENYRNNEINVEKLEQYIAALQKLSQSAKQANNAEAEEALDFAVKLMQDKKERGDSPKKADVQLSGSPSDQLLQLAQKVRDNTLTPTQRTAAASRLVRMGKGR